MGLNDSYAFLKTILLGIGILGDIVLLIYIFWFGNKYSRKYYSDINDAFKFYSLLLGILIWNVCFSLAYSKLTQLQNMAGGMLK